MTCDEYTPASCESVFGLVGATPGGRAAGVTAGSLVDALKGIFKRKSASNSAALTERQIGSKLDDVLEGTSLFKQSKSTQYLKSGGFDQANHDFDALTRGVRVVERGDNLRTATLSNGTKVNVRPFSSGKSPTLEVDTPGNPLLKIRY